MKVNILCIELRINGNIPTLTNIHNTVTQCAVRFNKSSKTCYQKKPQAEVVLNEGPTDENELNTNLCYVKETIMIPVQTALYH